MARIVCISKYPPLQGGISAKTYWLAKALRKRGHAIHVVTDREDASEEYRTPSEADCSPHDGFTHRPTKGIPWHIPSDRHRAIDLLNVALDVIREYGAEIIDTGYLIPYGIVGYLAGLATGVPFVIRHGGSDLAKFLHNGIWSSLLRNAIGAASVVITDPPNLDTLLKLNPHSIAIPPYVPDPSVFNPHGRSIPEKPVLALIGKANYHWRHKGWDRAIDVMQSLEADYRLVIMAQGVGLADFKRHANDRVGERVEWNSFVHPEKMPHVLRSVSAVFNLSSNLPFMSFSNIAIEAFSCGAAVITDGPHLSEILRQNQIRLNSSIDKSIAISPNEPRTAYREIGAKLELLAQQGNFGIDTQAYENYVNDNERCLLRPLRHLERP